MWSESQALPARSCAEPSIHPMLFQKLPWKVADLLHIQGEPKEASYANTTMRINHMFVSLRIAMCQTFTGEKQLSGQIE